MRLEQDAMQIEDREKAIWTAPVLKKGAVGSETAMTLSPNWIDGLLGS